MAKVRDPLEPVATTVNMVLALIVALTAIGVLVAFLDDRPAFGIGSSSACVEARIGHVPVPMSGTTIVADTRQGVTSNPSIVRICTGQATAGQRALAFLAEWPANLVTIGGLLLAIRLFRNMRRDGVFADRTAARLRALGWYVLIGEVAAASVSGTASLWLLDTMMVEPRAGGLFFAYWDVSFLAVFLGVALISFARIMRISIGMREDLEGTV